MSEHPKLPDIEPCPFCGWSNAHLTQQTTRNPKWQVICGYSLCYPSQGPYGDTASEAVARWNCRIRESKP